MGDSAVQPGCLDGVSEPTRWTLSLKVVLDHVPVGDEECKILSTSALWALWSSRPSLIVSAQNLGTQESLILLKKD